ncbi:glyoxalase [Phaeobacter gallaeciensis]|uniref:glyoxalase n=1 Tax=Phaeobacter gallaeciensis TaxID=60890 RepID=UPI00237FB6F8|nr:glyoxalase [Phaeobacter gallaeciensis]MDE4192339.1 glyoxalase [Phaeobacter gallaeciensis]MDE4200716.1 glyoxalase [Phaeobacter gallaeciensis]MDE4204955.1 glyoxalase [Phaeobacter gallaeciensis]MDE4209094.1 glyoxalase [Phaeobacter gallaeciensis]MDE4217462.1 glyoxalase [Phaeobacter gallaeciensis]
MIALDHIQIAIPKDGEPKARAFWCEGLGLAEIEKPEALKAHGGLWLSLAGSELHLGVEEGFTPARKAHPGFAVDDIDTIESRRRFFAEDPFGNRLEFLQKD